MRGGAGLARGRVPPASAWRGAGKAPRRPAVRGDGGLRAQEGPLAGGRSECIDAPRAGPRAAVPVPRAAAVPLAVCVALLAPCAGPGVPVARARAEDAAAVVVMVEGEVEGDGEAAPRAEDSHEGDRDDVAVAWPERVELVGATRAQGEYRRVGGEAAGRGVAPRYAVFGQSDAAVPGLTLEFKADGRAGKGEPVGRWTVQDASRRGDGWDRSEVCAWTTPPHEAVWRNALGQRVACVKGRRARKAFPALPFSDTAFPASTESLGPSIRTGPVDWVRAAGLGSGRGMYGPEDGGGPHPCDVHGGDPSAVPHLAALDAMAMVAGRPEHVRETLLCEDAGARGDAGATGRVTVRLFNPVAAAVLGFDADEWVAEVVSDRVPVVRDTVRPVFAQPCGGVTWPLLVEKALAKREGSYQALSAHGPLALPYFLTSLVGCREVEVYTKESGRKKHATYSVAMVTASAAGAWSEEKKASIPGRSGAGGGVARRGAGAGRGRGDDGGSLRWVPRSIPFGHTVDVRGLWGQLCEADDGGYLMAATAGAGQARRGAGGVAYAAASGLVPGRAYTILQVRQVSKHKLIQLRDHGGGTGWNGPWGRGAQEWARHPDVSMALLGKVQLPGAVDVAADANDEDTDGTFWIPFDALVSEFDVFTLAPWPA